MALSKLKFLEALSVSRLAQSQVCRVNLEKIHTERPVSKWLIYFINIGSQDGREPRLFLLLLLLLLMSENIFTFSALEVLHSMRYINLRFTYLL